MKKIYIIILLIAALAIGTLFYISNFFGQASLSLKQEKQEEIIPEEENIIKVFLESPGFSSEIMAPEDSSVYDLMVTADSQYDNFSFAAKDFSGIGFFVEEINGLAQDQAKSMYWIYYINEEKAPLGVSQYKIKANDVITWKYEKGY